MAKRIPIIAAKDIAFLYKQKQVIIVTWSGEMTHVVTYGVTLSDCEQAAIGGNKVKAALGWPESLCEAEPARVKKRVAHLQQKIADAVGLIDVLISQWEHNIDTPVNKLREWADVARKSLPKTTPPKGRVKYRHGAPINEKAE